MRRLSALLIVLSCLAQAAQAHDADIVYVRVERSGPIVAETMTLTELALGSLVPLRENETPEPEALTAGVWMQTPLFASGKECKLEHSGFSRHATFVELDAQFHCEGGELEQRFKILSVLPRGFRVVVERGGAQQFAEGNAQTVVFSSNQSAKVAAPNWILLGVLHIFMGIDHLAFLLALLLTAGNVKRVIAMVTSFTVAHSITLGATALGAWTLSEQLQRGVEALIALSIIVVATQNLIQDQPRHRALITFSFGLIHGFGFASVLQSYGVQASPAKALFGFNLGAELGQLAFVAVLFPLLRVTRRWSETVIQVGSVLVLVAGGYWLAERLFS
ncbi:MAG: HupE/UreJ family protein [Myxococcaceae bacterium]